MASQRFHDLDLCHLFQKNHVMPHDAFIIFNENQLKIISNAIFSHRVLPAGGWPQHAPQRKPPSQAVESCLRKIQGPKDHQNNVKIW